MKLLAALFLLVAIKSVSAQEPIKFRGAYVGEPLSDFVDCSSKARVLKEGYKIHGKICDGKSGVIYRTHAKGSFLAGAKIEGESFSFLDKKIVNIVIWVPNDDWGKVRYDLVQKLGEPASEVPDVYQNAFGAKWEYSQGFWSNGNIVVTAGIKVEEFAGEASRNPLTGRIDTRGIQISVVDSEHAKLPSTRPSTLD